MLILISIALGIIVIGICVLMFIKRKTGILAGRHLYQDSHAKPGELLSATSIHLVGKPDYLIEESGDIIPVEVKTGKTPHTPYLNHTMQLMAYCLLVEETYHHRPKGGYLVYPEKQFPIEYTKEAEASVRALVLEIMEKKRRGEEPRCSHTQHR